MFTSLVITDRSSSVINLIHKGKLAKERARGDFLMVTKYEVDVIGAHFYGIILGLTVILISNCAQLDSKLIPTVKRRQSEMKSMNRDFTRTHKLIRVSQRATDSQKGYYK
jgi:hypothetical protein